MERAWLALIALSFGLGGLATLIFPYLSEVIYSVGVDTNVIMALAMGVFLAWNKNWRQLGLAIFSGACLTVVANDLLDLVLPDESQNAAWFLLFSAVAICVAVAGMSILIGGAALATTVVRGVIHYIRNTRRRRLGNQVRQRFANCAHCASRTAPSWS